MDRQSRRAAPARVGTAASRPYLTRLSARLGVTPPWKRRDVHWHGYHGTSPHPNTVVLARDTRFAGEGGVVLRNPSMVGRWVAGAVLFQRGMLARWDALESRFAPWCHTGQASVIHDRVADLVTDGRPLYLALPAAPRAMVIAIEAVTRSGCSVSRCPLAGPEPLNWTRP